MRCHPKPALNIGFLVFVVILVLHPVTPGASVEVSEELAGAAAEIKRENYEAAVQVLTEYPEDQPLSSYARYLLSRAYLGLGNQEEALSSLEGIEAGSDKEVLEFEKYHLEAEIMHALGRNGKAAEVAEAASDYARTTKEEKKSLELRLSIARQRDRHQEALELSVALLGASNLRFIGEERDQLFDRTEEIIDRLEFSDLEPQRHLFSFIETLVRYREYRRARSLLLRHMGDWSGDLRARAYFQLAWLDSQKLDFPEEALWTYQRLFQSEPSRYLEAKGRYYHVLAKDEIEDNYELIENLFRVNDRFPDTYYGKLAARKALEEETESADIAHLDRALDKYRSRLSRSDVRKTTWRLFFKSFEEEKYGLALDYLGLLESYYESLPPKFLFWRRKARIASPDDDPESYLRVVSFQEDQPTDYYSLLAEEKGWPRGNFRVRETWSRREIGLEEVEDQLLEKDLDASTLNGIELAISLKEHGLVGPALTRLERLESLVEDDDYLYLKFQWERLAENYRESLKAASELMDWYYNHNQRPPIEVVRAAYPTYFSNEVDRAAGKFGLPEHLIYAVIRQESAFDRDAYSTAKAGGLMQVIPSTASGIAQDLGATDFQFDDLFDPRTAVEFGSYYVDKQVSGSGDIRLGLVAYHGGPGNLSRWQESFTADDIDLFLERIPRDSTENYVKAVYRNYLMYRHLY